jgi:hypothetical protein
MDWRTYNMSPKAMFAIYAEAVKKWIVELQQNPALLSDGKIADAIAKHVSVLQKLDTRSQYMGAALDLIEVANQWLTKNQPELKKQIDPRGQYLGVAIDLIKVANTWLAENQPGLKEKMDPYWENIYQELVKYSTQKGIF